MAPKYLDGDYLLCTREVRSDPRGVVVIAKTGGVVEDDVMAGYVLKRFDATPSSPGAESPWTQVRLEPLNPLFRAKVLKGKALVDLQIVAEVVDVLGR